MEGNSTPEQGDEVKRTRKLINGENVKERTPPARRHENFWKGGRVAEFPKKSK